jgi:hypothetical protein
MNSIYHKKLLQEWGDAKRNLIELQEVYDDLWIENQYLKSRLMDLDITSVEDAFVKQLVLQRIHKEYVLKSRGVVIKQPPIVNRIV